MSSSDIVTVDYEGYITAETEAAIGLSAEPFAKKVDFWLPKSQIETVYYDELQEEEYAHNVELEGFDIPEWLADKQELDYDDGWEEYYYEQG